MHLTNFKRRTKVGNCPTFKSVNICKGPIQLKVQHEDQNSGKLTRSKNQPENQLIIKLNNNLETPKLCSNL